jgi:hypothetical protein
MYLTELIKTLSLTGTAQEVAEALNTPIERRSETAWTANDLLRHLTRAEVDTVLASLESAPLLRSAFIALSITGLELASDERQAMLDEVAVSAGWSAELLEKLKRLGRPLVSHYRQAGLGDTVDEQSVQEALDQIAAEAAYEAILRRADMAGVTAGNAYRAGLSAAEVTAVGEAGFLA